MSVLHWGDDPADTLRCLASVAASTPPPALIAVLDNGTASLDAAAVAAVAPAATVVAVPENLGFAGGHDLLLDRLLAAGATHVLLLNNDATVAPDAIAELVRAATAEPRVGAVGAKVLSAADPTRLWLAWGRITWRAALVERVGRGQPDGPAFDGVRAVEWVPGCAMLLTREALAAVGPLDDAFFAYHEDVDWCVRARAAGFRVLFAPAARVIHRGEGSLGGRGVANPARYLSARNTMLFARKHAGVGQWLSLAATIGGSLAREAVRGDPRVVRLLWRGYRDGLLGRPLPLRDLGLR